MKYRKAFTLIELLVVISIISLLSSLVLTSLEQTRVKARNVATTAQINQYRNAFALYAASHNGQLPLPDSNDLNKVFVCLGTYLNDTCGMSGTLVTKSATLSGDLSPYLPNFPPVSTKPVTFSSGSTWLGAIYTGCQIGATNCLPYLFWYLQGNNQSCNPGIIIQTGNEPDPPIPGYVSNPTQTTPCLFILNV